MKFSATIIELAAAEVLQTAIDNGMPKTEAKAYAMSETFKSEVAKFLNNLESMKQQIDAELQF